LALFIGGAMTAIINSCPEEGIAADNELIDSALNPESKSHRRITEEVQF